MKLTKAIRLRGTWFTCAILLATPILSSRASVSGRESISIERDGTDSQTPQRKPLTVDDVVNLVRAGISDDVVASRIRQENRRFDLSPDQIIELKKDGVSDAIIKLMIDPKTEERGGLASGVTGKYYDKKRPAEYLELNPDHTFYRSAGGAGITGTYQLNGNEITLNLQAMGTNMAFKGNVEGDRITMEEPGAFAGKVTTIYVRRNANSNVGSVGSKESAQPPVSPKASCADYNSCLKSGIQDHMASQWQQAITDLEEASKQSPTEAAPWGWQGRVYLALGRNQEATTMWDKTLNLGGPLVFQVCLERGGSKPCERGNLSLAPAEVSFTLLDRRNVFAVAPTEVRAMRRFTNSAHGFINLQVKEEKYLFEYSPDGGNCRIQSLVECPQNELQQQLAVRNYVLQTIPKLASIKPAQPAGTAPTGSSVGSPQASIERFIGSWGNQDPNTRTITRVDLHTDSNLVTAHMWGRCHPQDCDWGQARADVSEVSMGILRVTWVMSFAQRTQQLIVLTDGRLKVDSHTHYTDNSGRADNDLTDYFVGMSRANTAATPDAAAGADYKAKYPQEYAFFKAAFDQSNGKDVYPAQRDSTFSMIAQKVEALQQGGSKISVGGMLSLLIYEGQARLAHYNTLCRENSYDQSTNCWQDPKSRYSYQLGLGAFHTSNFFPCPASSADQSWTRSQREKFTLLAAQAGFSPTAEQIASVGAELHQFCPGAQPQVVDYYILRANDLGIPTDKNGNFLTMEGKYPFFVPSLALAFFFSKLDAQPSQLTSDEKAICIWGTTQFYCCPKNQVAILAKWDQFTGHLQPTPVVVAGFQTIPTPSRGSFQFGRDAYYLVPMVIYDGSRYKFLPHEVPDEDPMVHPLNAQDFLGQSANPDSPRVRELIQKSILSKVNLFDVYRKGRKVGYFTVKNPVYFGPFGQVVAVGTATGFTPTSEDIAIAGAPRQPDFLLPPSKLSLTQTKQLESMVMALFPKTIPTNPVAPTAAGQPIRLKTTWENLNVFDPQCSGNLVVSLERKAVVTSTVSASFTASSVVLAQYNTQTKSFDKLASWAIIAQGNKIVFSNGTGDEFLITFKSVLDVSGDGIPELILLKGIPAASPVMLLYEFQNGKLHLVGSRGWEVGFELTTPETISGLYGTD